MGFNNISTIAVIALSFSSPFCAKSQNSPGPIPPSIQDGLQQINIQDDGGFNPGMVRLDQDHLLLVYRLDKNKFDWPIQESRLVATVLDNGFSVLTKPQPLEIHLGDPRVDRLPRSEDPRLFNWNGNVYLLFNDIPEGGHDAKRSMFLAKVSIPDDIMNGKFNIGKPTMLDFPDSRHIEKNWVPLVDGGQLYFIYSFSPYRILKYLPEQPPGRNVALVHSKNYNLSPWFSGIEVGNTISGGTPAVADSQHNGDYLLFFHSSYQKPNEQFRSVFPTTEFIRTYYSGAMYISKNFPFEIQKISKGPILDDRLYQDVNREKPLQVVFPEGIELDKDYVHLAMGHNDDRMFVWSLPRTTIEKSLENVEPLGDVYIPRNSSVGLNKDREVVANAWKDLFSLTDQANKDSYFASVHLETVNPDLVRKSRFNLLFPNPEFHISVQNLRDIDLVLCKTRHCVDALKEFRQLHDSELKTSKKNTVFDIVYTKFTTPEDGLTLPDRRDYSLFVHNAGKSPFKNTSAVLLAWLNNPDLYEKIIGTCSFDDAVNSYDDRKSYWSCVGRHINGYSWENIYDPSRDISRLLSSPQARNMEFFTKKLTGEDWERFKRERIGAGFLIAPSAIEGFGHYINEARRDGLITITTDHYPMNELIRDGENGLLIKLNQNQLHRIHGTDAEVFEAEITPEQVFQTILRARAIPLEKKIQMSKAGIRSYWDDRAFFLGRMNSVAMSFIRRGNFHSLREFFE